jgi:ABC-type branched-subunit amino acid transport system ATPase component
MRALGATLSGFFRLRDLLRGLGEVRALPRLDARLWAVDETNKAAALLGAPGAGRSACLAAVRENADLRKPMS